MSHKFSWANLMEKKNEYRSDEMYGIIGIKNEIPTLLGEYGNMTLYRFSDNTDVIDTNGGILMESDNGFWDLWYSVVEHISF